MKGNHTKKKNTSSFSSKQPIVFFGDISLFSYLRYVFICFAIYSLDPTSISLGLALILILSLVWIMFWTQLVQYQQQQ